MSSDRTQALAALRVHDPTHACTQFVLTLAERHLGQTVPTQVEWIEGSP